MSATCHITRLTVTTFLSVCEPTINLQLETAADRTAANHRIYLKVNENRREEGTMIHLLRRP